MIATATDWAGIAAVIAALGSAVASIIAALLANRVHQAVQTGNGHTLGELATNTAAAVTTPPTEPRTLGEVVADTATAVEPPP